MLRGRRQCASGSQAAGSSGTAAGAAALAAAASEPAPAPWALAGSECNSAAAAAEQPPLKQLRQMAPAGSSDPAAKVSFGAATVTADRWFCGRTNVSADAFTAVSCDVM
jgi:hypothetical protein